MKNNQKNLNTNSPTSENEPKQKDKWFNEKFMPIMTKFASQTHLTAIRDAFGILTPIIIGGSISFLLGILIFGAGGNLQTSLLGLLAKAVGAVTVTEGSGKNIWEISGGWLVANQIGEKIFQTIFNFSMGTFALMISIMLGYIYAKKRNLNSPMFVAVFNLVLFLITAATFRAEQARFNYFYDSKGMLAAIIQTFLAIEFYRLLANNKKLLIKMPKQVPPMVATGFSLLIPVALTLILVSTINTGAWAIGNYSNWDITSSSGSVDLKGGEYGFVGLFYKTLSSPFTALISGNSVSLGFGISYQFLIGFFWFFGLNGSSVVNGAYYPFLLQMFLQNANAVSLYGYQTANANGMLSIINIQFLESYSQTTGWGHTGALLIAMAIFGKVREQKEVVKIAAVPACFSINEPVTFGIPIMLHPVYGIGAMFAMPITTLVAWIVVGPLGWVRKSYIMVPWTLPPGIGALLSTGFDWKSLVLSWTCLAIVFVWYIPFVLIANKYQMGLNIKNYMDTGLTREDAIKQLLLDDEEYQETKKNKKIENKEKKIKMREEKQKFKLLTPSEQQKIIYEKKMLKLEKKSFAKVDDIKIKANDEKNLVVEVVPYGGYKIKINKKTVAIAMNEKAMFELTKKICQTNKIKKFIIINDREIIKTVELNK